MKCGQTTNVDALQHTNPNPQSDGQIDRQTAKQTDICGKILYKIEQKTHGIINKNNKSLLVNAAENCSNAVKRTTTSQPAPEPPSFTGNLKQQQQQKTTGHYE